MSRETNEFGSNDHELHQLNEPIVPEFTLLALGNLICANLQIF